MYIYIYYSLLSKFFHSARDHIRRCQHLSSDLLQHSHALKQVMALLLISTF